MEQRVNLKFLVKLGKTLTEAYAMLKEVYGNECLSRTQEWFKGFKVGRETTEDDPRNGQPSTSKTDENIGKLIREDRRLSIRGIAEITGIDKECVRQFLHESSNMRKVCAKNGAKTPHFREKGIKNEHLRRHSKQINTDPGLLDKMTLKGTIFESVEAVKAKPTEVLNQLTEADFQHCFQ
ncbi:hypothetical protein NQ318_011689 [Aromia moschata]|uniref:Mos1 transposase HTH domain-containing protein n=1 Tax=Aromia moschata TaxID=1265417 RepID=A0AAV8XJS6_9CUCU|nr:hypothetical protein NQ318_011689 [Aromia moschata]